MQLITLNKDNNIKILPNILSFLNPSYIYVPIYHHKLKVTQNEKILKGQELFINNHEIISSISGTVIGIANTFIKGKSEKCLVIKNDFKEKRIITKRKEIKKLNLNIILDSLEQLHLKNLLYKLKNIKTITNLIINCQDDEPYNQNSIMLFQENISELLKFIDDLSIVYKTKLNAIILRSKEKNIIEDCINMIGSYPNIKLSLIDDLYLLGKEKYLLEYFHYNASSSLVLSINELMLIYNAIYNHKVSTNKLITISGDALEEGYVLRVKKYSSLDEIIAKYFKLKENSTFFVNGLMSGWQRDDYKNIIITEDVDVINIMKKISIKPSNCFYCGKCISICPVSINPIKCYEKQIKDKRCLNCGLCNYICPARLDLKSKVLGEK